MKKLSVILLLVIVCLNHLNIADAVMHFSNSLDKKIIKIEKAISENGENEKETKGKGNLEEDEKFLACNEGFLFNHSVVNDSNRFFIYNACINIHPYTDDDLQPPRFA